MAGPIVPFERFGGGHGIAIALTIAASVAAARAVRAKRAEGPIRWGLAFLLAAGLVAFLVVEGRRGDLSGLDFLPFHLSDFTVFLAIFALATLRQRAAELLYFLSLAAVLALVTPDVARAFPEFRTIVFFVLHGGTIVAAAVLTFGYRLVPERGAVLRAMLFLNLYALAAAGVNQILGTNFLYLRRKPRQPSPLDWMGEWPWYLLTAELVALALFGLAWLPFALRRRRPS